MTFRRNPEETTPRVTTTDGRDPDEVIAEQRAEGNVPHKSYVVMSEEERARGFTRRVMRSYVHIGAPRSDRTGDSQCLGVTSMGLALCETYARDPSFYGATFCASCGAHFPVGKDGEFVWLEQSGHRAWITDGDGTHPWKVGT